MKGTKDSSMALTVSIVDKAGAKKGEYAFQSDVFNGAVNEHVIYEVIKNQMANKRQGTASTKTRSQVRGTTRKPWRQKGTGRARAGSRKSPLWRGGGVIFGPHPRDYSYRLPKKVRHKALVSVVRLHLEQKTLLVLEDFDMQTYSTREMNQILGKITQKEQVMLILNSDCKDSYPYLRRSSQNIRWVKVVNQKAIELKDLHYAKQVVVMKSSMEAIEARVAKQLSTPPSEEGAGNAENVKEAEGLRETSEEEVR